MKSLPIIDYSVSDEQFILIVKKASDQDYCLQCSHSAIDAARSSARWGFNLKVRCALVNFTITFQNQTKQCGTNFVETYVLLKCIGCCVNLSTSTSFSIAGDLEIFHSWNSKVTPNYAVFGNGHKKQHPYESEAYKLWFNGLPDHGEEEVIRLWKRPQSQCHRADSAGEVAAQARLSIRFGRCEQFAASLRRVAIVLPGEIEKQNAAGTGGGGWRKKAASCRTWQVRCKDTRQKWRGRTSQALPEKNCIRDESAGGASV